MLGICTLVNEEELNAVSAIPVTEYVVPLYSTVDGMTISPEYVSPPDFVTETLEELFTAYVIPSTVNVWAERLNKDEIKKKVNINNRVRYLNILVRVTVLLSENTPPPSDVQHPLGIVFRQMLPQCFCF
ncbi:MAG: hypothetical protein J6M30_07525 [Bacteroidales bacterium]|nr:hypothetical protein [Bacteroidales bacterium]